MLTIGVTGLNAAQLGISTTGNNIANVNTPGYSRETLVQTTLPGQYTGSGYIGQGTDVESIVRAYNSFAVAQARDLQSQVSSSSTLSQQLSQVTTALGNETQGIGPAISQFFAGLQTLASSPSDPGVRTTVLSNASGLVQTMQTVNQQLIQYRSGINQSIQSTVGDINNYASQIADLNNRIAAASTSGQPPNSLLDQRDQIIQQLSQDVQVSVTPTSTGAENVFLGNGQSLVVGASSFALTTQPESSSPGDLQIAVANSAGVNVGLSDSSIAGGALGGLLAARDGTLTNTQNALGQIATVLATQVNQQNALGMDLNGKMGGAVFTIGSPTVSSSTGNSGTGVMSALIANASALTGSDYRVTYTGAAYNVTRLSDNTTTTYGALPQTVDGVTISIAGAPVAGDSFTVEPTRNALAGFGVAITDPSQIAAAAPVAAAASTSNLGSATISQPTVVGPTANANLQKPVTITFTGAGTFNVTGTGTGNPVGVAYTSGGNITYNGWTLQISGTPQAGDTFTVGTNTSPAGDNRNVNAMAALQNASVVNGSTLAGAYSALVGSAGAAQQGASVSQQAQQAQLTAAQNTVQSTSGVNLDEEAANLITYQQAYQASAKYIQIASDLFTQLLTNLNS
jgi:flagellar hook-associated protein 1 FlgK